jgi:peptide methionine sulfoxide reductase MsrA
MMFELGCFWVVVAVTPEEEGVMLTELSKRNRQTRRYTACLKREYADPEKAIETL